MLRIIVSIYFCPALSYGRLSRTATIYGDSTIMTGRAANPYSEFIIRKRGSGTGVHITVKPNMIGYFSPVEMCIFVTAIWSPVMAAYISGTS